MSASARSIGCFGRLRRGRRMIAVSREPERTDCGSKTGWKKPARNRGKCRSTRLLYARQLCGLISLWLVSSQWEASMNDKSRRRSRKCGAVVAFCLFCAALLPAAAEAQDSTISRIEAIERQIGGLQSELR